jgi:hypothetical protein
MRYKDVSLIILIMLFSNVLRAGELYEAYNGIRAMGMGGASVAVVNDETALITNPAALGKLRSSYITVIDPEIHGNKLEGSIAKDNGYNPLETTSPQKILDALKQHPNKHFNAAAYLFPSVVIPNFVWVCLGLTPTMPNITAIPINWICVTATTTHFLLDIILNFSMALSSWVSMPNTSIVWNWTKKTLMAPLRVSLGGAW